MKKTVTTKNNFLDKIKLLPIKIGKLLISFGLWLIKVLKVDIKINGLDITSSSKEKEIIVQDSFEAYEDLSATLDGPLELKESIARTKLILDSKLVTKKDCANYEYTNHEKDVRVSERAENTEGYQGQTEEMPLADTHFTNVDGKDKCFAYIFDTKGSTLFLIKCGEKYAQELRKLHPLVSISAFPRSKDPWYSVSIDNTWTKEQIYSMLDDCIAINHGDDRTPLKVKNVIKQVKTDSKNEKESKKESIKKKDLKKKSSKAKEVVSEPIEKVRKPKPKKKVNASEVKNLMSDETAHKKSIKSARLKDRSVRTMINIDTICEYFNDGETVTLKLLKERIPNFNSKATFYKVCARGEIDKALIVDADDFSVDAKKMILLAGGKVIESK